MHTDTDSQTQTQRHTLSPYPFWLKLLAQASVQSHTCECALLRHGLCLNISAVATVFHLGVDHRCYYFPCLSYIMPNKRSYYWSSKLTASQLERKTRDDFYKAKRFKNLPHTTGNDGIMLSPIQHGESLSRAKPRWVDVDADDDEALENYANCVFPPPPPPPFLD